MDLHEDMSRPLRYQPEPWMVHFVTIRCLQARYLLRPGAKATDLIVGVLERAAERTGCRLHGVVALSNHLHLLVSSETATHLADYMQYVAGNVARELGRLHRWRGKFWHRRYHASVCLDDAAQVDRLGYLLANGPKERLVRHARYWPGLHTYGATCLGQKIRGIWVDRTAQGEARRRGEDSAERHFTDHYTLTLHKLPCWAHLDDRTYAQEVDRLYRETVERLGPARGAPVLGEKAVLRVDPHAAPASPDQSPAPRCHGATREARDRFRAGYALFVQLYREAMECLVRGVDEPIVPDGGVLPWALRPAPS